jgi:putative ABC transport system ATP-binding protein
MAANVESCALARDSGLDVPSTTPVIVDDVQKRYITAQETVAALSGVSLVLERGQMVALMGPSGCGKSTLLSLIGCQDRPSSGRIAIEGRTTTSLNEPAMARLRRERVGMVFQSFNLLASLSVLDNVALPLILQGRPSTEFVERATSVLEAVGVSARANAYPHELSGGQQQRVAIARAIVHEPAVLLADEATGNLDTATAAAILVLLRELASRGQAILIATHSAEVAAACDRVVHLRDGKILP